MERVDEGQGAVMITHQELVSALVKSGETIAEEITGSEAHLIHMVIGVSGEAGELLDAVKKSVIYRKPLDMKNMVEELGDLEFYMEGLRQGLGITREECLKANIEKLQVRYAGMKYSNESAQTRADKIEEAERDMYADEDRLKKEYREKKAQEMAKQLEDAEEKRQEEIEKQRALEVSYEDRLQSHLNMVFSYTRAEDIKSASMGFKFFGAGRDRIGGEVHVFERVSLEDFNKGHEQGGK